MKSSYKRLGDFIEFYNIKAIDLDNNLDIKSIRGISSISKSFIKTKANLVGVVADKYKVVTNNCFAYNPNTARMGDKIPIALNITKDVVLVSSIYPTFKIIKTNELDPEYLMMWFKRYEFDRYARYKSHGSAREVFDIEEMNELILPIPSIEKQKELVKEYNIIQKRISLNNQLISKLEEAVLFIYKQLFEKDVDENNFPNNWELGVLSDICDYSTKRIEVDQLELESYISTENMLQNKKGVKPANNLPNVNKVTCFENDNILISNIRPYFKKIWLSNYIGGCSNDVLCFVPKRSIPSLYLYQILEKDNFFDYVMAGSKGTKMPRGDKKWIMNYGIVIPNKELLDKFDKVSQIFQKDIQLKKKQNQKLEELKDLLLAKMTRVEN